MANQFSDKINNISTSVNFIFLNYFISQGTYKTPSNGEYFLCALRVSGYGQYRNPISVTSNYFFTFYNKIISTPSGKRLYYGDGASLTDITAWSTGSNGANIQYVSNNFNIQIYSESYSYAEKNYGLRLLYKIE